MPRKPKQKNGAKPKTRGPAPRKPAGRKPRAKRAPRPQSTGPYISECVREFNALVANPFRTPKNICLPLPPGMPAQGLTTFTKGTFATGTAGFGFVILAPNNMVANDSNPIYKTTAAFAGITLDLTATGSVPVQSNSPYPFADFGSDEETNLFFRLVASGVRCRNITSYMKRGGLLRGYTETDHATLEDYNFEELSANDACISGDVDGKYTHIVSTMTSPVDPEYKTTSVSGTHYMALVAIAADPTEVQTYEFDAWAHFQLIGSKARGKVPVKVDIVGTNAALDAQADITGAARVLTEAALNAATASRLGESSAAGVVFDTVARGAGLASSAAVLHSAYRHYRSEL